MVTELGNQTLSRQEDQRFPSGSAIVGKGTDHKLRALPFLHLDSFALYAALSARLAFFAVCYRAIACFLPFKTKGSSRVNTVIKSFCSSSPWPIDLESNEFLCFGLPFGLCPIFISRESSPLFWWCGWECFSVCLIRWNSISISYPPVSLLLFLLSAFSSFDMVYSSADSEWDGEVKVFSWPASKEALAFWIEVQIRVMES